MQRPGVVAFMAVALMVAGCGGGGAKRASGEPKFKQAARVALSRLPSCPGERGGAPAGVAAVTSVDRQQLQITGDATLECGGKVIFHWFRFKDVAARESFSARIGSVGRFQNPFLVNRDVVVRVENAGDAPPNARALLPSLAADIKSACRCGEVVQP